MRTLLEIRFEIRLRFSPSLFFFFLRILAPNSRFQFLQAYSVLVGIRGFRVWSLTQVERVRSEKFRSNYFKQLLELKYK